MGVWWGCKIFVKSLPTDKYKQGDCHLRDGSHLKLNQVTPHRRQAKLFPVWLTYLSGIVPVNSKYLPVAVPIR